MKPILKAVLWIGIPTSLGFAWILSAVSNHSLEKEVEAVRQNRENIETAINQSDPDLTSLRRKELRLRNDLANRKDVVDNILQMQESLAELESRSRREKERLVEEREEWIVERKQELQRLEAELDELRLERRMVNAAKQWENLQSAQSTSAHAIPNAESYRDLETVLIQAAEARKTGVRFSEVFTRLREEDLSDTERKELTALKQSLMEEMESTRQITGPYQGILQGVEFYNRQSDLESDNDLLFESLAPDPQGNHVRMYQDGRIEYFQ